MVILILFIFIQFAGCDDGNVLNCDDQLSGDPDKCQKCQSDFEQVNWSCCSDQQKNCFSCFSDSYKCDSCQNNSYCLSDGDCPTCISQMDHCATCSSCSACLTCDSIEYTINASKCIKCSELMSYCKTCTSKNVCTSCLNNTYTLNATKCIVCSIVLSNCTECISQTACITCVNNNFALNATKCTSCSNLMQYCLQCNSSNTCITCLNNSFAINTTSSQCAPCSSFKAFCSMCNSANTCIACEINPNIVLNNSICVSCLSVMPNCQNCTTKTYCTLCSANYYILNQISSTNVNCINCKLVMAFCSKCSSKTICTQCMYGKIVLNGCSNTPGCTSVFSTQTSICKTCNETYFYPNATNGVCICLKGHLAGQYCTQIIGCTNAFRFYGNSCTMCDRSLNFILANGNCLCKSGYQLNGLKCSQICGDGKLFDLPCDDGNLFDGDGCSSTCQIQQKYGCQSGSSTSPSHCIYVGKVILTPVCIYKMQGNSAKIIVKISPYVSNIMKSNINITFHSYKNCTMSYFEKINGNIIIYINYLQSIEGTHSLIKIQYDPNYIISAPFTLSLYLNQCNGDKLFFDPNTYKSNQEMFSFLILIFSAIILLVWFIGSYSHKMIGVETLHTFHLIFISQAFSVKYSPVVIYFKGLHNILNIYQSSFTSQSAISQIPYSRLSYSSDVVYNSAIVTFCEFIALFLFLGIKLYQKKYKNVKDKPIDQKQLSKINWFKQFIYEFLVFPLFIGFFLNFSISLLIYCIPSISKYYKVSSIQVLLAFFSMFGTTFVFFSQWKQLFGPSKQATTTSFKKNYIPLYLTNILILSIIIQLSLVQLISQPFFILFGATLLYTIIILIYRPYQSWLDFIGIIVNQLGVILNLLWLNAQNFTYLSNQKQDMIAFILIGWMVLILLIAVIRIIFQLKKKMCCPSQIKEEQKVAKKKVNNDRQEDQMLNAIMQQRLNNINSYLLTSQIIRGRQIQQYQYNQQRNLKFQLLKNHLNYYQNNSSGQIRNILNNALQRKHKSLDSNQQQ